MLSINELRPGMVIANNKDERYVIVETNLNGEDDYWSSVRIITETEFQEKRGISVNVNDLLSARWIDKSEYMKEFHNCYDTHRVIVEKIFIFE